MRYLFLFLFSFSLFAKENVDFLFYCQDAGETNALLPVIELLEERGFRVAVLAAGTAEALMKERKIWTFSDLGSAPVTKQWERTQKLDEKTLLRLFEEIEPKAVVTGVAFESEGQVLDLYKDRPTFAFWDNFNSDGENPYFRTARSVAVKASTLLLPSREIEGDFEGSFEKRVVGHPTIEQWRKKMKGAARPGTALFIGGYGTDYEEAFALFLKCAKGAPDIHFFVQPHPKTDGSFEKSLIFGLPIRMVENLSTIEAVGQADLILCHQSTVAFQALACGKRVIHVIPESQFFDSLPLQKGLALRVHSPEGFERALEVSQALSPENFDRIMGIPSDSKEKLFEALVEAIPFHCGTR